MRILRSETLVLIKLLNTLSLQSSIPRMQFSKACIRFKSILTSSFPFFFKPQKISIPTCWNSWMHSSTFTLFAVFDNLNPFHGNFRDAHDEETPLKRATDTSTVTWLTSLIMEMSSPSPFGNRPVLRTVETSLPMSLFILFWAFTNSATFDSSLLLIATCAADCSSFNAKTEVWKRPYKSTKPRKSSRSFSTAAGWRRSSSWVWGSWSMSSSE